MSIQTQTTIKPHQLAAAGFLLLPGWDRPQYVAANDIAVVSVTDETYYVSLGASASNFRYSYQCDSAEQAQEHAEKIINDLHRCGSPNLIKILGFAWVRPEQIAGVSVREDRILPETNPNQYKAQVSLNAAGGGKIYTSERTSLETATEQVEQIMQLLICGSPTRSESVGVEGPAQRAVGKHTHDPLAWCPDTWCDATQNDQHNQ